MVLFADINKSLALCLVMTLRYCFLLPVLILADLDRAEETVIALGHEAARLLQHALKIEKCKKNILNHMESLLIFK